MATTQTTLTAEGQSANTSATVTIPSGASYVFGLYTSSASGIPASAFVDLVAVTPGGLRLIHELTGAGKPVLISGPVDVKAVRPDLSASGINVGVYYNQ
jgi:hypothetical protein